MNMSYRELPLGRDLKLKESSEINSNKTGATNVLYSLPANFRILKWKDYRPTRRTKVILEPHQP